MTDPHRADDRGIDPVVAAGPTMVSELVGWQPDLLCPPERRRTREVTGEMTDEQVLAHYRVSRWSPYMNMRTAKALRDLDLKYRHLALAAEKANEEAAEEQRRQPRALVDEKAAAQATRESSADSGP
jgi:hypothetical protein